MSKPAVLFVCVHNAGRSQMAAAFARELGAEHVNVYSAGSAPGEQLNPAVVAAMAEVGLDISSESPRRMTDEMVRDANVIVTMGCGDACPYYADKRYEDWELDDPAGQDLAFVRGVRDEIYEHVRALIDELVGGDAS